MLRRLVNRNLRGILEKLPKTLDETYERVLRDINEGNREHARRLLHCIAVAVRPLRVEELAEILAFDFDGAEGGIPKFHADWRSIDQEWAVLSTCSSLITVVDSIDDFFGKCRVVQFSHFSVKEFLLSDRLRSSTDVSRYRILPGPAHTILAQACLGFLLHLDVPTDDETGECFPLAMYAAVQWVEHAKFRDVASRVKDGMLSLFDPDKHHLAAWLGIYDMDNSYAPPSIPNPLYYAASCGFHDLIKHLVNSHPQLINTVSGCYGFPLVAALKEKHFEDAEFLLQHGGRVDIWGEYGMTPLEISIHPDWLDGDIDAVSFLLRHGADPNVRGSDLVTPLHVAALNTMVEVVKLLLNNGADVDPRDNTGKTPLLRVDDFLDFLDDGDQARDMTCLVLLNYGASVNAQDNDGDTPLLRALRSKHSLSVSQILLKHGADPNLRNNAGENSLHVAINARFYDCDIVRLLLRHGVNVNNQDKDHTAPLHLAMTARPDPDLVQILLEHNAQPDMANIDGKTSLHLALVVEYSNYRIWDCTETHAARLVRLLLEHGADVNAQDKNKTTPLLLAIQQKMYDITRVLLSRGAEPNVKDDRGRTPLHLLLEDTFFNDEDTPNPSDLARALLDRGMYVKARHKNHTTPLMLVAERHMVDIARILLERGADPNVKNIRGKTPLHLLLERNFRDQDDVNDILVVEWLLEHGADLNAQDEENTTPLNLAYHHRRSEIAQVILDRFNAKKDPHPAQSSITLEGEYHSEKKVSTIYGFTTRSHCICVHAEHGPHKPPTLGMLLWEARVGKGAA